MRRALVLSLAAGLLAGVLPASPAAGQSGTITLSVVDASDTATVVSAVGEDDGLRTLQVKAEASAAVSASVTVSVTVGGMDSTATNNDDYAWGGGPVSVMIRPGDTEDFSGNFTVTPASDTAVEGNETIQITGSATGYTVSPVDLIIADADFGPIVLSVVDASDTAVEAVGEDGGQQTLRVKATAPAMVPADAIVSVTVGAAGGTATVGAGNDYELGTTPVSLTISSMATEGLSSSFTVTPASDTLVEGAETIRVTGAAVGYTVSLVDLVIADADFGSIALSVVSSSNTATAVSAVGEDDGAQTLRVKAVAPAAVPADTTLSVTVGGGTASFTPPNSDYSWGGGPVSVTISSGAVEGFSGDFTVTPASDTAEEGDETIRIRGAAVGYTAEPVFLTITDADLTAMITLSFDDGESTPSAVTGVTEDGGAQMVRVVATAASAVTSAVTVAVSAAAGTATETADYALSATSTTVTIASGQTVGYSSALTVTPVDDTRVEGDETIVFSSSSGYTSVTGGSLDITDDDDDAVALSVDKSAVMEYSGQQSVSVTAEFTEATASDLAAATEVTVTVAGGAGMDGATLGSAGPPPTGDFSTDQTMNQFTVNIGAGAVSGSGSFNLSAHPDADTETGGEKVALSGTVTGGTVTGTEITIHDAVITLSFTDTADPPAALSGWGPASAKGLGEDAGRQTVRVAAAVPAPAPADAAVAVTVAATGGTATAGAGGDYTTAVPATVTVTITSGATSGSSGDLVFTTLPDRVFEDNETIKFTGTVAGYAVEEADLLIVDADRTLAVTMNPGPVSDLEYPAVPVIEGEPYTLREYNDSTAPGGGTTSGSGYGKPGMTVRVSGVTSSTYSQNLQLRKDFFSGTAKIRHGAGPTGNDDVRPYVASVPGDPSAWDTITITAGSLYASNNLRYDLKDWGDQIAEPDETFEIGVHSPAGFTVVNAPGLVVDDDVQISLSSGDTSVAEGSSGTNVSISASMDATSSAITSNTVVSLTVDADGGEGLLDAGEFSYTSLGSSVTVPASSVSSVASAVLAGLAITDDTVVEGREEVRITGRPALAEGASQSVTFDEALTSVWVTDDDANITLSVSPGAVVEKAGGQTVTVVAEFAGDSSVLTSDTEVVVQIAGGTATLTTDFTTGLGNNRLTVRIPAGRTSGANTFQLTAVDDSTTESSGETVTFEAHGTVTVGGGAVTVTGTTLTINDPGSEITLSLTDTADDPLTALDEDGGAQTVRVVATVGTPPSGNSLDVTVTVGALGGTADATDDYTASVATATVTIADGVTSGTADITITPVSDTVTEDHETIYITGEATGYVVNPVSLRITDADRTLVISMPDPVYVEGTTQSNQIHRSVQVAVSGETSTYSNNIRVRLGTENGSATVYNPVDDGFHTLYFAFFPEDNHVYVTIGAGDVSGSNTFGLVVKSDPRAEPPEDFYVTLVSTPAGFQMERGRATIVDRVDTAVQLNAEGHLTEGGNGSDVNVTAGFPGGVTDSDIASDTVVALGAARDGSATGDDFTYTPPASALSLTIPMSVIASPGSGAVSLSGLSAVDDTVVEGPETVRLTGSYMLGGESREATGTVTIWDDDANIELSVSPETVVEGTTGEVTVTAKFKGASTVLTTDTTVTVQVASGDGTGAATLGASGDFTTDATGDQITVTIPAGALSGSGAFNLTAATDSNTEGLETGKLTGSASMSGQTLTVDPAAVTIADPGRGIALAVEDADTGTSGTQTSVGEAAGTVTVQISATLPSGVNAPAGGTVVGVNVVGGTAVPDDDVSFATGEDFRVSYPSSQTPPPPAGHSLAVNIASGQNSGTATFTITLHDDDIVEGTETIVIEGGDHAISSTTYKVTAASFQITDSADDTAPAAINLTLRNEEGEDLEAIGEGDRTATIRVRAVLDGTKVFPRSVTVPLEVGGGADDVATSGTDFEMATSPSVVFLPHTREATAEFELEPTDDDEVEGPEALSVHGGTIGAALTALGITTINPDALTLLDNDIILTLLNNVSGEPFASAPEGTNPDVRVQLSYPGTYTSTVPRVVRITVVGETATANRDYGIQIEPARDIFFPIARNKASDAFGLNLRDNYDDNIAEGDETLLVTAAATGFAIAPSTITIIDNDDLPTRIAMSASASQLREGSPQQVVTVTVGFPAGSGALPADTAVTITVAGTATASDYTISSNNLIIPAGSTSTSFTITITDDEDAEEDETIILTARTANYNGAVLTLTIEDDDPPPGGGNGDGGNGGGQPPGGGGGGSPPPSGGGGGGTPPPAGGGPVTPPAEPACQGRFCDEDGSVHEANIERIATWRITLGCDAQDAAKYCPSERITRRQMAAFLYRAVSRLGPIDAPEGIEIADVPADAWYRTFADWVVSVEAFAVTNGLFNPGGVVSRADMAIMMIAAFPHLESVEEPEGLFNDVADLDPAIVRAIEGMYGRGVTKGCTAEPLNYCPDRPVTRAQMASFFVRAIDLVPAESNGNGGGS